MENVRINLDSDNKLHIIVDLSKPGRLSASGKTTVIASTRGNKSIEDEDGNEVYFGLNVYKY